MNTQNKMLKKYDISSLILESSFGVIIAVALLSTFMVIFTDKFLTAINFFATSRAFSLWVVVGFAQMATLVIGQMNISVGAIGGLSAVTVGYLFQFTELPIWIVVLVGLLVGMACGSVNGIIITKTGIQG
jgi:ribose transport system permease protein